MRAKVSLEIYFSSSLFCILLIFLSFCVAADIISAIEFDRTGDHLASGDQGGQVVLFERTDVHEVQSLNASDDISFLNIIQLSEIGFMIYIPIAGSWK